MLAVVFESPGPPDVLHIGPVDEPVVGRGDVLVRVAAAGVNRADLLQRQGHYPAPPGAPSWLGLECSGWVEQVGDDVSKWQVGDQVAALLTGGGYAERVVVPTGQLLPVPDGVELAMAAALPEVACTVWSNVFHLGALGEGESLLVHGGGSGIGTMAIQLAKAKGARVLVTCGSAAKVEACGELGADFGINYREQDFVEEVRRETDGRGVDVILDVVGAQYLDRNVAALATNGRLVVIGLQGGAKGELNLSKLMARRGSVHGTTLRSRPADEKAGIVAEVYEHVWPLVEAGAVRPVVDRFVPWEEAASAHAAMESGENFGKVVLLVAG